jgi:hypothetical protein
MRPFKFLSKHRYTESDKEYYDTDEFELVGITPALYEPFTFDATKCMLFKNRETGEVIRGNVITINHPMWDYHERI